MRYFGTLAFLAILSLGITSEAQAAIETNTNTKTTPETKENITKSQTFTWSAILEQSIAEETATSNDPRDHSLISWKAKQAHLWNALPDGKFTINASAYTAAADECGKSDGITASGVKVQENRTLACPPSYPFGAKVAIEGYGIYTCEDRGGAIKNNHFDIYMETKTQAFAFGRKNLTAEIIQ
ncbi:MAG: 3D domain-containing protein [Candidatus Moraniibacteriota bacterium]|nr:MAG: 3D domain-containing protein [Candidatus Moranbacteria bacterium]